MAVFDWKGWKECRPAVPWKDHILTPLCMLSGYVSAATWLDLNESKKGSGRLEGYVIFWLVFLFALLVFGPASGCIALVFAWLGMYRLQDLVLASLDNVFGLTERGIKWQRRQGVGPVVIAVWNILQVIVIFALAYQNLAGARPGAFEGPSHGPSGHFGFLYLSWTTLFPPGSGYTPISTTARVLVMAESTSGLLIIVLTLAALLSSRNDPPAQDSAPPPPPPDDPHQSIGILDIASILVCTLAAGVLSGFVGGIFAAVATQ